MKTVFNCCLEIPEGKYHVAKEYTWSVCGTSVAAGRQSVRANRSLFGDRRVVVEVLVLANESDVYNDPNGSFRL